MENLLACKLHLSIEDANRILQLKRALSLLFIIWIISGRIFR